VGEDPDAFLKAQVKAEIRRRRRSLRRGFPSVARRARSEAIAARVQALDGWARAQTVLAFVSMRTEVQTDTLVEAARAAGKAVAAPRMTPSFDDLELRAWTAEQELEESGMMFLQPPPQAPRVADDAVDLVLVPALAVDERGYRIGYGKGFYDRLLPRLTRALRVALIFDFERIAEVPTHAADVPVHVVVTDASTHFVAERAGERSTDA
jgi:5-formyltetrahydrofolate cyclo-ligase